MTAIVTLLLAAAPAAFEACVTSALEQPELFTLRLVTCGGKLSPDARRAGLAYAHERPEVTEHVRRLVWNHVLDDREHDELLKGVERESLAMQRRMLFGPAAHRLRPWLEQRALQQSDAFGLLCAEATVSAFSSDPVLIELAWQQWLRSPTASLRSSLEGTRSIGERLQSHLIALRESGGRPRRQDLELVASYDREWGVDELLSWVASADADVARDAMAALATSRMRVGQRAPPGALRLLTTLDTHPDPLVRRAAVDVWARFVGWDPSAADLRRATALVRSESQLAPSLLLLSSATRDHPKATRLLFELWTSDSIPALDEQDWHQLPGTIATAPGAHCWLPGALLGHLRLLSDEALMTARGLRLLRLAEAFTEEHWGWLPPYVTDRSGPYCPTYVGGPHDQRADRRLFGLEWRGERDVMFPKHDPLDPAERLVARLVRLVALKELLAKPSEAARHCGPVPAP